jgi:radical SAM family uncharacterized protein
MTSQMTDSREIRRVLDRHILANVETPGRYTGGEVNAVHKDLSEVEVSFALLFPDVYEVGMSYLGYQVLYAVVNSLDWAVAERAYAVWPDMQAQMRAHGIPLYTLESARPVRELDVVGFSLQYELLYTNVLAMLALAGIPLAASDRGPGDPIVIAGGPGAAVPEPMADFIDLFFVGDGEEAIVRFAELVREAKDAGADRREIIVEAARRIGGVYAPAHYHAEYRADGLLEGIHPVHRDVPEVVRAAKVADLETALFPTRPVVPFIEAVHDRVSLEIMRGCTRGCRFCQAGMLRRPVRARSVETLCALARETYPHTGHADIALASLSSSDYPGFLDLLEAVSEFAEPAGIALSLSSLRVTDQLSLIPEVLGRVRKSGLTIAPEASSDRLRRVINKDITEEELIDGVREAYRRGWNLVKLYFMIGLPTETDDDVIGIARLSDRVSRLRSEVGRGKGKVNVSVAAFVPKAHTPFQWEPMATLERIDYLRKLILDGPRLRSVRYGFHRAECSVVEGALARGDRRLGAVLLDVHRRGGQFDAWREHFSFDRWLQAFAAVGLRLDFYAHRERGVDEVMPWDHIDFGVTKEFLLGERDKAFREELTPDCRQGTCAGCGACRLVDECQSPP